MNFFFGPLFFSPYLYPESQHNHDQTRQWILSSNQDFVKKLSERLGLNFTALPETEGEVCFMHSEGLRPEFKLSFTPQDVLDYMYAVLHSPACLEKYQESLPKHFPDIPCPADASAFWQLVQWGHELRQIHSLESQLPVPCSMAYPVAGNNIVETVRYEAGKVFINPTQYFEGIPETAWLFSLSGAQPARKWLKDRTGHTLSVEDILHYQKIIIAITETGRVMKQIAALCI